MTPAALRACAEDILAIRRLLVAIRGQAPHATIDLMHDRLDAIRERLAAETPVVEDTRIPVAGYIDKDGNSVITRYADRATRPEAPDEKPAKATS